MPEPDKRYSTSEAAAFLGVTPRYMRYLLYEACRLKPDARNGRHLRFTLVCLLDFQLAERDYLSRPHKKGRKPGGTHTL